MKLKTIFFHILSLLRKKLKQYIPRSKKMKIILSLVGLILLVHIIHAVTFDRIVQYKEIRFESKRWPKELDGYKIAFVSDIHLADEERLWQIRDKLNKQQIDLLLLGGDFFGHWSILGKDLKIFSEIKTRDSIFGIEGNHDKYDQLFEEMVKVNITPLSNSGLYIRNGFFLAGVEDLWNRHPDIEKAIADANRNSFILLLSHNPDVSMKQNTEAIDLFLSGHTHGGQMNLFDFYPLGLHLGKISAYGTRFKTGWAESRDGTPVYVGNGIGAYYPRVFARPQVITFKMYHSPS